jgi:hypothetical protein
VPPRILGALARPTIGHLDPEFVRMMDELKGLLRRAFITDNALTVPISAPGSAGMEACFVNLIEPGDTVDRLPERCVRRAHEGERAARGCHASDGDGRFRHGHRPRTRSRRR